MKRRLLGHPLTTASLHNERALRYARSLRPNILYAVHFAVDNVHAELTADGRTEVTAVLPRRAYGISGYLLHTHNADRISAAVSSMPRAAATIVPFDVDSAIRKLEHMRKPHGPVEPNGIPPKPPRSHPAQPGPAPPGTTPAERLRPHQPQTAQGVIGAVDVQPNGIGQLLRCEVNDHSGRFLVLFCGRTHIPGIAPGRRIRVRGTVGRYQGEPAIANPKYDLLESK